MTSYWIKTFYKDEEKDDSSDETNDEPTIEPTVDTTVDTTVEPTIEPTIEPTVEPTIEPTVESDSDVPTNTDSSESSDQDELKLISQDLHLKDDTEVYMVMKDSILPLCYVKNIDDARSKMWMFARMYRSRWLVDYNTYIREDDNINKIKLVGYHKFTIMSYERLLSTFEICTVKELN